MFEIYCNYHNGEFFKIDSVNYMYKPKQTVVILKIQI